MSLDCWAVSVRRPKSSSYVELPHNSTYGERAVMWSAAALPQEAPAFSRA